MQEINAVQNKESMEEDYTENNGNLANIRDGYGFFDPDRCREHREIDIGEDSGDT